MIYFLKYSGIFGQIILQTIDTYNNNVRSPMDPAIVRSKANQLSTSHYIQSRLCISVTDKQGMKEEEEEEEEEEEFLYFFFLVNFYNDGLSGKVHKEGELNTTEHFLIWNNMRINMKRGTIIYRLCHQFCIFLANFINVLQGTDGQSVTSEGVMVYPRVNVLRHLSTKTRWAVYDKGSPLGCKMLA